MNFKTSILLIFIILAVVACTPEERFENQLDKAMSEEFDYLTYSNEGFSVLHPDWPDTENQDDKTEVSVSVGYCTVLVNSEKMLAKQWYNAMLDSIDEQDTEILDSDEEDNYVKYSMDYQDFKMISRIRMYDCNELSHAVIVTCISDANNKAPHIHEKVYGSVECEKETKEEIYNEFEEDDFEVEHPDWNELEDEHGEERVLGLTKGVCSLIINKHNALPKDIINWLEISIDDNDDQKLLRSTNKNDVYYIDYELPYEDHIITAKTKLSYCNYMTYMTQVLCINELSTEHYEEIRENVLDSAICAKKYEIPTPIKIEEKKKEVEEEEPEIIEEIEDEIVQTDIGEEFGIDEEMVVYFINSNDFFTKIMKEFSKVNIVFEDKNNNRELELRAEIGNDGKITLLEDGRFSDADVTMMLPLRDALNIFSNAQNINPLTLLGFAVNVRTEPASIKNEIIQGVLSGKYN